MTRDERIGCALAVTAFSTWGVYPLFFKQLDAFGVVEILCHRIVWSFVILFVIFAARLRVAFGQLRAAGWSAGGNIALATVFITFNWFCFILAVNSGRVLEASLGYFLIPAVSSVFGVMFFNEALNRLKLAAVVISGGGIAAAFVVAGVLPWISLGIAFSFSAYGMMRKRSALDSATGLFFETLAMCPFALAFLLVAGTPPASLAVTDAGWLIGCGVITLIPLLTMVAAARRIQYNTLGFLQYITPVGHFTIAVGVYDEVVSAGYALAFATTWIAIAFYLAGVLRPAAATVLTTTTR